MAEKIVDILKELFPKVQFICATHSPFIIQSLEPGELITLDSILDEEYSGQSIEDIAEDVMNVKIAQYSEKKVEMYEAAEKYFKALKNAASNEDIEELKDRLDTYLPDIVIIQLIMHGSVKVFREKSGDEE